MLGGMHQREDSGLTDCMSGIPMKVTKENIHRSTLMSVHSADGVSADPVVGSNVTPHRTVGGWISLLNVALRAIGITPCGSARLANTFAHQRCPRGSIFVSRHALVQ